MSNKKLYIFTKINHLQKNQVAFFIYPITSLKYDFTFLK